MFSSKTFPGGWTSRVGREEKMEMDLFRDASLWDVVKMRHSVTLTSPNTDKKMGGNNALELNIYSMQETMLGL